MSGLVQASADARSKTIGQNFRCRAWGTINSNGTLSYVENISACSKSSGRYTITFSQNAPHTEYVVMATAGSSANATNYTLNCEERTTSTFKITTMYEGTNYGTYGIALNVAIFY